jgi:hypothetical protein
MPQANQHLGFVYYVDYKVWTGIIGFGKELHGDSFASKHIFQQLENPLPPLLKTAISRIVRKSWIRSQIGRFSRGASSASFHFARH